MTKKVIDNAEIWSPKFQRKTRKHQHLVVNAYVFFVGLIVGFGVWYLISIFIAHV